MIISNVSSEIPPSFSTLAPIFLQTPNLPTYIFLVILTSYIYLIIVSRSSFHFIQPLSIASTVHCHQDKSLIMDRQNRRRAAYWDLDSPDARSSANFISEFESRETQHRGHRYQNSHATLTNTSVHVHQGSDPSPRSIPWTPVLNLSIGYPSTHLQENGRPSAESFENYVPREPHHQLW